MVGHPAIFTCISFIGQIIAMPNLTDLIRVVPPDREEEVEDIYASAAYLIFPDDT
ncbi:hypothetical protein LTR53_018909, partial [Teratosphaeriaceae sp. CCFEE 6253]